MILLNAFYSNPFLTFFFALGSGFYGSIVAYAFSLEKWIGFKPAISFGWLAGPIVANAALSSLSSSSILPQDAMQQYPGTFVGIAAASALWFHVVIITWFLHDRKKPGIYGTLEQSYLEAAVDGIMVVSFPVTCFAFGFIGYGVQNFISSYLF